MPPLTMLIVVLVLAALGLWALSQFPLDATIVKIIRVIVIVLVCLYALTVIIPLFSAAFSGSGYYRK